MGFSFFRHISKAVDNLRKIGNTENVKKDFLSFIEQKRKWYGFMRKHTDRQPRERSKDEIPFRDMTPAQKRSYLWDYWKLPALVVIGIVAFVISLVYSMTHTKKPLLSVTVVDCDQDIGMGQRLQDYAKTHDIPEDQAVVTDTVVGTAQSGGGAMSQTGMAFYVRMQSGSEDLVVMPEEEFNEFAESGYFLDLASIVPAEWADRLIVAEQRYDDYEDEQPEPMACAIRLSDIGGFPDSMYTKNAVIAISYNPAHPDTAADFLNDLLRNAGK